MKRPPCESLETLCARARSLAVDIAALPSDPARAEALPLRLAQAHVLGLLDQLMEAAALRAIDRPTLIEEHRTVP